jgi:L-lactate dehydrogenase complex protein LldG
VSALDCFVTRARAAATQIHKVPGIQEAAEVAIRLAHAHEAVVVAPSLAEAFPDLPPLLGRRARLCTLQTSPGSFVDPTLGLVHAKLGISETGSVLLLEERLSDRLVSMLSSTVIQILEAHWIVDSLDEAADWIALHRPLYATLVTGPSRTADIERTLTIGVQGPQEAHVVVIGL